MSVFSPCLAKPLCCFCQFSLRPSSLSLRYHNQVRVCKKFLPLQSSSELLTVGSHHYHNRSGPSADLRATSIGNESAYPYGDIDNLSGVFLLFLDLVPPVPLGASGDEKSPSFTVTGDPAGSMPADTHLFQVFLKCTLPCLSSPVFWQPVFCRQRYAGSFFLPAIFLLPVVTTYWSHSKPALITSPFA